MSSPEQIFLSYLGSELHATQLSLSTMWIPPNPAFPQTLPIHPPCGLRLWQSSLGYLFLGCPSTVYPLHSLFALAPLTWSPICVDASLTLFCLWHPSLGPLAVPVPHSMDIYLAWTLQMTLGLNSSGRRGKGSGRGMVCLFSQGKQTEQLRWSGF